jgi:hypothetical protein
MTISEIVEKKVSFQPNVWSPMSQELSIGTVLDSMRNGKYASEILDLRKFLAEGNAERYESHKKRLPAVTFCGTFGQKRNKENLQQYNELLVIDIDKLEADELLKTKAVLAKDEFVFSFWESPSKKGIKGLIALNYCFPYSPTDIDAFHKVAFRKILDYFFNSYEIILDTSGSDITRLCFLSFDPELITKREFRAFGIDEPISEAEEKDSSEEEPPKSGTLVRKTTRDKLYNPTGRNSPRNRRTIQSIIKYLSKRNKSITYNYDNWYRIAHAIASSFTFDIGEKHYLKLCRLDGVKHDEQESKNMLSYCYENTRGEITFSTILFLAREGGYEAKGGTEDG